MTVQPKPKKATRADFPGWPHGPAISHEPLRKVVRRASAITNGWMRTYKHPDEAMTMVAGESMRELEFLLLAELDPNVNFVVTQPALLNPSVDGRVFDHTPDVALLRNGRPEIHEIKSDRALEEPTVVDRLVSAERYVGGWEEWRYLVASSRDLLAEPLHGRALELFAHHRKRWTDLQRLAVLDILRSGPMVAADVAAALATSTSDDAAGLKQVLSLAADCQVFIDMSAPIGPGSLLRFPDPLAMPGSLLPSWSPAERFDR